MEKDNNVVKISGHTIKVDLDSRKIREFAMQMAHEAALRYLKENNLDEKYALVEKEKNYISIAYFQIDSAYTSFEIRDLSLDNEKSKREPMLKKAEEIKLFDIIEEFRKTANESNKRLIAQFCNAFLGRGDCTLKDIISTGKEEQLKFRRVGAKPLDLFESFLNQKGFEFAKWNGVEWV